ncbi:MAG TPA: hypothetical protein DEA55_08080 [Rhodospirillaceae bacterium]|nr:hypothetical protein [Rhodospirillaceae bacterium]
MYTPNKRHLPHLISQWSKDGYEIDALFAEMAEDQNFKYFLPEHIKELVGTKEPAKAAKIAWAALAFALKKKNKGLANSAAAAYLLYAKHDGRSDKTILRLQFLERSLPNTFVASGAADMRKRLENAPTSTDKARQSAKDKAQEPLTYDA